MMNKSIASFICEASTTPSKPQIISGSKSEMVKIIAILQDLHIKNRNQRMYNEDLIAALKAPHITELIKQKSWVGEAGHPCDASQARQMTWDVRNLSHRVNKYWIDGGSIIRGEVEALNTDIGNQFHNLVLQDMKLAFSLRARGNITQTPKGKLVSGPIHVLCYDWVILPSHKSAYQEEIINNIQESTSNAFVTEGFELECPITEMTDFAKASSKNFKYVSEYLETELTGVSLNESMDSLIGNADGGEKVKITLESNVSAELQRRQAITDYMDRLF